MEPQTNCSFCEKPFTASRRKQVACPCGDGPCADCARPYLLESPNDPDCMSCHAALTLSTIGDSMPRDFVNGPLRQRSVQRLLDREMARMSATQPYADLVKSGFALGEGPVLSQRLHLALTDPAFRGDLLNSLYTPEKKLLKARIVAALALTEEQVRRKLAGEPEPPAPPAPPPVYACPMYGCIGIVSAAWRCTLCDVRVCAVCHNEAKTGADGSERACCGSRTAEEHAQWRKDRLCPCPKCATLVRKSDITFCKVCATSFDQEAREVVSLGEPRLYHAWRRARVARGDVPTVPRPEGICDTPDAVHAWLRRRSSEYDERTEAIGRRYEDRAICTLVITMSSAMSTMKHYQKMALWVGTEYANANDPHAISRMYYLLGLYDEAAFHKEIQARERSFAMARDCAEVHKAFVAAAGDLALSAWHARTTEEIAALSQELADLREYVNAALVRIGRGHRLKPLLINKNYYINDRKLLLR